VNEDSSIQVAELGPYMWVRVDGKGSFQNAADLKSFAFQMIATGRSRFVIDLCRCPMMDSTFMGTLVGIAIRLPEQSSSGKLTVVNANDRNAHLLENLGLTKIFPVQKDTAGFEEQASQVTNLLEATPTLDLPVEQRSQEVLEAHETLSEVSEENRKRFKDVVEFLRSDSARMD